MLLYALPWCAPGPIRGEGGETRADEVSREVAFVCVGDRSAEPLPATPAVGVLARAARVAARDAWRQGRELSGYRHRRGRQRE